MGARIEGIGTERLVVDGVRELGGAEHAVVADYLEAGTYAIAVAAAGGELRIECSRPEDLNVVLLKLEVAGAHVQTGAGWFQIGRRARTRVKPIDMSTWTYPGFPTDLQAQYMALMTQAEGETVISEYVHENRFQHVTQLAKMGAGITVEGRLQAVVHGPCRLRGTEVTIPDIRSGGALVIAALCAEGQSVLRNAWHVERGYEDMAGKLASVGAQIEKVAIDSDATGTERTYEQLLSKKIGIDLGTSTVLIYVKGEGIVVNEPSLVAVNRDSTRILAVGRQAFEMLGRAPDTIQVVRPMRDGVIADFVVTEGMLHHFIGKVQGRQRIFKPEIMICVPSGVTSVERRAVTEAAISAGARQAWLIDEPLAAAIGAGLPISEPRGNAICDIGGGTTEIAVISLSGMVVAHSIRVGGNRIDDAIALHLKRRHNLLIGERTAEELKIAVGSAIQMKEPLRTEVRGRDIVSGLPRSLEVTSNDVAEAIQEPLRLIVGAVRSVLEETPPELAADIFDRGIVLSGGGSQLRGLDRFLSMHTGITAVVADDPQTSVVRGTGLALEHFEVLKRNQSYLR